MDKPTSAYVAIVHFIPVQPGTRPIYYQVTVDPEAVTLKGYIRFGLHPGDEITGWQPMESIEVDEVLGVLDGNEIKPPIGQSTVTLRQV